MLSANLVANVLHNNYFTVESGQYDLEIIILSYPDLTDLSYPERLVKLKLLPLEYRREILDLCFFFKCLKGYIDFNVLSYVNFKTPKYNIRNSEATLVKGLF